MTDLKSPVWIYLKGWLFLVILVTSAGLLYSDNPSWKTVALLLLITWAAARFYYFMFYVIEKYVDPSYKFAGIIAFVQYLVRRRKNGRGTD